MEVPFLFKRVARSWRVFLALLLGVTLASTFFCSTSLGADMTAAGILDEQMSQVPADIVVHIDAHVSLSNITKVMNALSTPEIEGITYMEPLSFVRSLMAQRGNIGVSYRVWGLTRGSIIDRGLTVASGKTSLEENEAYVWTGAPDSKNLRLGDKIQLTKSSRAINLTIAGFVELEGQALQIVTSDSSTGGGYSQGVWYYYDSRNILIVDLNKTLANLMDLANTDILIFLDRDSLINAWDIEGSLERIWKINSQIQNRVYSVINWGSLNPSLSTYLEIVLRRYESVSQSMRTQFLIVSLPVFFVAWYLGTTVSDLSYNLRRREIGLLLAKGYSHSQLLVMFLSETTIIGLLGGLAGVGLSALLTPILLDFGGLLAGLPFVREDTVATVLFFSLGLALLSVFRSARRASKLDIVEALQEYRYVEEVKPHRMRWPWVAFFLGTYKIVACLLGINLQTMLYRGPPAGLGILLTILLMVWTVFDVIVLNYIGPLLFFWGFTKIFLGSSLMFQELVRRAARFMGDLGNLATTNLRRNPARTASIAFLIAMIIGFSFQAIGSYASEQDYMIRQIKFDVGADISVQLSTAVNASSTMSIIESLSGVSSTTIEYRFYGLSPLKSMTLVAIDPANWLQTAYCEGDLFTGVDAASAFGEIAKNNETIILEWGIADILKLRLGDNITVVLDPDGVSKTLSLKIVGLFGPKTPVYSSYGQPYWSYVHQSLYEIMKNTATLRGKILVKLNPGADGKAVAEEIRNLQLGDVYAVSSVSEILEKQQNSRSPYIPSLTTTSYTSSATTAGSMEIQRLEVVFAVLVAALGTVLVTLVSLNERSREVGLLGAKGLSFKQLASILLVENLSIVGFSVALGAIVGLVVTYGNISAANSPPFGAPLLLRHLVYPVNSALTLLACCALVLASTVIPVFIMTRRYLSNMERIVREV